MKQYYLLKDSFKNRMIVSVLAILVLFIFNFWFVYKDQNAVQAALSSQTFYIDNQLSGECLNYVVASRTCGTSSGIHAWHDLSVGLEAISILQDSAIEVGGHTIYVRSGTYYDRVVKWPVGASDDKRNIIRGYSNEIPVISGAKILANWQDQGSDIYKSGDLVGVNNYFDTRRVYQDDGVLTEARYPNSGEFMIDARGDGTYIEDLELIALYNQDPNLVIDATVEFTGDSLFRERYKIESVDTQAGRAYFYANDVIGTAPYPNATYRLIGKIEYLDQVGEYYYQVASNGTTGEAVSVKMASGVDPNSHLMEIEDIGIFTFGYGSTRPAYYMTFMNLSLKHGAHGINLQGVRDYKETFGNDFVHHITFDNVDSYNHARFGYVSAGSAHHIVIRNSLIENNNAAAFYMQSWGKPICGNSRVEDWMDITYSQTNPEQCDDGNLIDGDGCSSMCGLSGGYDGLAVEPWDDYYKSYITIDNNVIKNNTGNGITFSYISESTISNNTLEYNAMQSDSSGMGIQRGADVEIFGNSLSYQGGNGILLEGGTTEKIRRINVYDNVVHHSSAILDPYYNAWFGIWLDEADSVNVYDNTFYAENGRGLAIGGTDNSKVIRNKFLDVFFDFDDSEIRNAHAAYMYEGESASLSNNIIAHNVFTGKFRMAIDMYATNPVTSPTSIHDNQIVNNIFYSTRSDEVQMTDLELDMNHALNTYNNNIFYAPDSNAVVYIYQDVEYPSLAAFRAVSGNQESNSLNTNPLFTNFASNNFTLQSNSPAIDNAMLLTGINDSSYQGQGPDIGLFEYASGPVCGNYSQESGEQCDDGNTTNNDGCSSSCQTEVASPTCSDNIQNGSETGIDCGGSCPACSNNGGGGNPPPPPPEEPEIACGNSIIEQGETCDDGNIINNDGCSYLCQLEDNTPTSTTPILDISKLQGTLVKTSLDPKVYYINTNNERYLIPNLNTFKSWFKNFNNLTIITPQTLASFTYIGRLTVKPGNLVQFKSSNKVYAVEPEKTLRWITTGSTFKDFGYDFKKIISLPEEDFQYYTQGEDLNNSTVHPTGQLLKHGNFPPIFYIKDNIEYWIKDETTFLSLGFKWQDIITIPVRYWYTRILDNFSFRLMDR